MRIRGRNDGPGGHRDVALCEMIEARCAECLAKPSGCSDPSVVHRANGLPPAGPLPEGAAFCVERAFGGLDSLENTDRCRRAREAVPAVAAGLGNGEPGADEVAEDLRGEGRRYVGIGHDLAELDSGSVAEGLRQADRRPEDVVTPIRQRHVHAEPPGLRVAVKAIVQAYSSRGRASRWRTWTVGSQVMRAMSVARRMRTRTMTAE